MKLSPSEQSQLDKLERRIRRHLRAKTKGWKAPSRYFDGYVDGVGAALRRIERINREEDRKKGHP